MADAGPGGPSGRAISDGALCPEGRVAAVAGDGGALRGRISALDPGVIAGGEAGP